ncbi:MAG: CARDB domain-containing protein [Candidatus Diapherotrites archaeon]
MVIKKFLVLLALLSAFSSVAFAADAFYLLSVTSSSYSPSTVYPGDFVSLSVDLKNVGYRTEVSDLNAVLLLPNGFSPADSSETVSSIKPDETKTLSFSFYVGKAINAGTYTLSVQLNYPGVDNKPVSDVRTISLAVSNDYKLDIQGISLNDLAPHSGDAIEISAVVKNIGSGEARQASVELVPRNSANFSDFIVLSETKSQLGNIAPGESKNVLFSLRPKSEANPGIYTFDLNASCLDCSSGEKDTFSFEVLGSTNMIFSGFDYSIEGRSKDKKLLQGDSFSFSVQLDNIGTAKAKAAEVLISSPEGLFNSEKKSFVGNIDAEDSGSAVFDLILDGSIPPGDYGVKVNVNFLDESNKPGSIETTIPITVYSAPGESPVTYLVLIAIILVILYFLVKMVFRQLALRKHMNA